jgi:hypothetical protein
VYMYSSKGNKMSKYHVLETDRWTRRRIDCVCAVYRALLLCMAKQHTVDSSVIRIPLYFYFVEVNNNFPPDSALHWNMADSSGIQWNRREVNALSVMVHI